MSLTPDERESLERWASGRDRRRARRAALVLGFAAGEESKALARRFRLSEPTVSKWRSRFQVSRLDGLVDAARPGAPRRILADDVDRVIDRLRQEPPAGMSRWTTRSLARACGVSQTTVSRIWRAHGIDPRSGTLPAPTSADPRSSPSPPSPAPPKGARAKDTREVELVRLARELKDIWAIAPPEQSPFLRVALEAIEAALSVTSSRLRSAQEGSRLMRQRTAAAVAQARTLVKEAKQRVAELRAMRDALFTRPG